ncbi:helix-turn-helix domain-containing protein [Runella sp. SP2]|uniref:helix-turn-helix domain-containing protein n=1 Tax=Runella sp. SP2 TaxID=2268026 RepID=UPI000F07F42B|nr:helix-turn-helix transcriptional regulator [Runella sp. SP2]AYQ36486.1 XRE family transcriptional regulator [Runella sp. SP2]
MTNNPNITSLEDILDLKYGPRGTEARENWEQRYEAFKIGVLIEEARKSKNMTQAELAAKIGTNKSYISRIENDASDIRLSTLFRIIHEGLGGHLKLKVEF